MIALTDLVAVVTGATSGIGRAISLALAAKGATVCLLGRKREVLQVAAEQITRLGACVYFYKVDLSVEEEIQQVVASNAT